MTPDLKRLCEAAEAVLDEAKTTRPTPSGDEDVIDMEVIVRAVLKELRETSGPMRREGGQRVVQHFPRNEAPKTSEGIARDVISGVIDQILAGPPAA